MTSLKRCFVRNSKSRWNAGRLLSHPFLKEDTSDAKAPKKVERKQNMRSCSKLKLTFTSTLINSMSQKCAVELKHTRYYPQPPWKAHDPDSELALSAWFKGSDDDEVNAFKTVLKGVWE
ncbi:hypothetical protein Scep_011504 [Stephania cephalantha]|uniref:Uncharacterized protein n=1 Tax=Stephania cephalantha TaxID=152367 RepID=A0AAP0JD70_9MAGN